MIERRRVRGHQWSMLGGLTCLGLGMVLFGIDRFLHGPLLPDAFGAYGLLLPVMVGLTVLAGLAGGLAYWSMVERAWSLHRRAGMFAVFSGSSSSAIHLLLLVMKAWMT